MEIGQLKAVLEKTMSTARSEPSSEQVAAFNTRLEAAKVPHLAEHAITQELQSFNNTITEGLRNADSFKSMSPESVLAIQHGLASSVIGIDLTAKVAGAFSQGINKLVSMQ